MSIGFIPETFIRLEEVVAHECAVTIDGMRSRRRNHELVAARFVLWYLTVEKLNYTYSRVARFMDRDHTTIISGVRRAATDPEYLEIALNVVGKYPELFARPSSR